MRFREGYRATSTTPNRRTRTAAASVRSARSGRNARTGAGARSRASKERDDRRGLRPHATPDEERLSGLFDQHAQAVCAARAFAAREFEERGHAAVHHLVRERVRRENTAWQRR